MAGGVTSSGAGTKSPVKIVANIFISFLGSGVLGLPYAFKEVSQFQQEVTAIYELLTVE